MKQNMSPVTRYYGVQALRGFAAMMVVLFHVVRMVRQKLGGPHMEFTAGAAGVDIFFAISGFVIVITTAHLWGTPGVAANFLKRRLLRIVPLYWLITACMVILLMLKPDAAQHSVLTPWHTVASFLFIPAWNAWHEPFPVVTVGWTLSFEMFFYALFAATLAIRANPVTSLSLLFGGLAVIGLWRTDEWGAPATLIDPLLLEFVFGMLIGVATLKGMKLPQRVASWLVPLMIVLICATCVLPTRFCFDYRVIIWGIPGALLVASAIALEERWGQRLAGLPRLLGDASYAIYLSHGLVISFVAFVLTHISINYPLVIAFGFGSLILSAIAGILIYRFIERPLIAWLQKFPARPASLSMA